jgi:hypothetical protein
MSKSSCTEEILMVRPGPPCDTSCLAASRQPSRPLVRIKPGTRLRVGSSPVEIQNHFRPPGESRIFLRHVLGNLHKPAQRWLEGSRIPGFRRC